MSGKRKNAEIGQSFGVAECAARTGLSVRALHVYEQRKLIKPFRDANGWRRYSAVDLSRLNTISVLKSLGLKLSEIRTQITSNSLSLESILRIQSDAWKARVATAEAAIELVDGALNHVKANRALPIDQLCALVRMFEMNMLVPDLKRRIADVISPDDFKVWSQWWIEHPDDLAESTRYEEAQLVLFRDLKTAMDGGAKAESAAVQELMSYWESLFLRHHIRERTVRQIEWNHAVTLKWYTVGHRNRTHEQDHRDRAGIYSPEFASFLSKAHENSNHGRAINAIHLDVAILVSGSSRPSSGRARKVAKKFAKACSVFSLGDCLTYAKFSKFIEQVNRGSAANLAREKTWHFLQQALEDENVAQPPLPVSRRSHQSKSMKASDALSPRKGR